MSSVTSGYQHIRKVLEAAPTVRLKPGLELKWYNLRPERSALPAEVQQEARDFLRAEVAAGLLAVDGEQGFVVLHLARDVFLLLACTWRNDNELWESSYVKRDAGFRPIPADQSHNGTFCVWEMGAVQHEQQAWIRYLNSARDAAASAAYLADQPDSLLV